MIHNFIIIYRARNFHRLEVLMVWESYSLYMQCELLKEKYFLKHFFTSFLIWFANRTRFRRISALVQCLYIFLEIAHEPRGDRTLIWTILWK